MHDLEEVAPAFVEMAHNIVWCSVATVDGAGRPRSRVLHPMWTWDGDELTGWVATGPTAVKRAHLAASPYVSCNYWAPNHDTCIAECHAELLYDDDVRAAVWERFASTPEPLGYEPSIVPVWDGPTSPTFAVLKMRPWRVRVFPGTLLLLGVGDLLTWHADPV